MLESVFSKWTGELLAKAKASKFLVCRSTEDDAIPIKMWGGSINEVPIGSSFTRLKGGPTKLVEVIPDKTELGSI